jgi:hypothetical protein
MAAIRVDGNDVLAVYNATATAREYALKESKPVLVEAIKELKTLNDELKGKNEKLEVNSQKLEARLNKIEALLYK